jgi:hypothetical protein
MDVFNTQRIRVNGLIRKGRFAMTSQLCAFEKGDYGARFTYNGKDYTIQGFVCGRRRWPVEARRVEDNRAWYFPPCTVLHALGRNVVGTDGGKALFNQQLQHFAGKYKQWQGVVTPANFLADVKPATTRLRGKTFLLGGFDTTNPTFPIGLFREPDDINFFTRISVDCLKNAWGIPDSVVPHLTKRIKRRKRKRTSSAPVQRTSSTHVHKRRKSVKNTRQRDSTLLIWFQTESKEMCSWHDMDLDPAPRGRPLCNR